MSFKGNIRLLKWFHFFSSLSFFAPLAIIYFSKVTGSYALAASIFSIAMVSSVVFEIPTGVFSDRIGRKRTLVLGTLCAVIGLTSYAIGGSYWVLIIGAIFDGVSKSLFSGNNDALLHNTLTAEGIADDYHIHYGKISTVLSLGLFISSLLSSFIASWSFMLLLWLSVITQVIAFLISLNLKNVPLKKEKTGNIYTHLKEALIQFKTNKKLRLLSLGTILGHGIGATAFQFQAAVYSLIWPLWAVGIARALGELLAMLGFHFSGKIIERLGKARTILFSTISSWVMNVVALLFPSILTPLIIPTSAILYGPGMTASEAMKQEEFTEKQRATIASLNSLGASLVFAIFSFSIGLFADAVGPIKSLLIVQLFFIMVIVVDWKLYKSLKSS